MMIDLTRYGALAVGATKRGHLLDHAHRRPGQLTAALCGEKRRKWQPVDAFPDPTQFSACAPCTRLAAPTAPRPPVRIAPPGQQQTGRNAAPLTPALPSTAQSRLERRIAFRDGIPLTSAAAAYRPRSYRTQPTK